MGISFNNLLFWMHETSLLDQEEPVKEEPKFIPFHGVGRRLDGKPSQSVSPSLSKEHQSKVTNRKGDTSSSISSRQHLGKLVFGSNASEAPKETKKVHVF